MKKKVCVAMSGGVDSSVAAALLKENGYDVFGVFMKLWDDGHNERGCCSLEDSLDALRVAEKLNIPFYVLNFKDEFYEMIVQYFLNEYISGRTPNPCIMCNKILKFDLLLKKAKTFGADYLATGHYARVKEDDGNLYLYKGLDKNKDQTYFLFNIEQSDLKNILFPLGYMKKEDVRLKAKSLELLTARKKESQEICFVAKDYRNFLKERGVKEKKGYIIDLKGNVLGEHKGYFNFTIGQRSGLNISLGKPVYVIKTVPEKNIIIVGEERQLYGTRFLIDKCNFFEEISNSKRYFTKVRYRHVGEYALISKKDSDLYLVEFETPQRGITPGQAAVFYDEEKVIGGGWIKEIV